MIGDRSCQNGNELTRVLRVRALQRLARAIYGADWIGRLTEREKWLIEQYVDQPGTAGPTHITYVNANTGRPWVLLEDQTLAAEVARARDRHSWCSAQYERVFDWLENHGFDSEADSFDAAAFDQAFAVGFPSWKSTERVESKELAPKVISKTGAPGRPSSMHLIKMEFTSRESRKEVLSKLLAEAEHLVGWLKAKHPSAPAPTPKTVENNLRARYREYIAKQEQRPK